MKIIFAITTILISLNMVSASAGASYKERALKLVKANVEQENAKSFEAQDVAGDADGMIKVRVDYSYETEESGVVCSQEVDFSTTEDDREQVTITQGLCFS